MNEWMNICVNFFIVYYEPRPWVSIEHTVEPNHLSWRPFSVTGRDLGLCNSKVFSPGC